MGKPTTGRVKAFDWLRGLAVVFMVECHALVVTRPDLRVGVFFGRLNFFNGLVAPSFIFAAGFSLGLVQVRGAQGPRMARVRKTLRRIGEVLAVGTFINFIWFPVWSQPYRLGRMDILQCIGLSLLMALPIVALLARRPRWLTAVTLACAAVSFGIAPLLEHVTGPFSSLLNRNLPGESVFPLFPWVGYVFMGAATGAVAASAQPRTLKMFLLALAGVGGVLWALALDFVRLYPPHVFWVSDPSNHGERWTFVCLGLIGLLFLEEALGDKARASLPVRFVETLGTSSLAAYFFHEMLIYFQFFGVSLATLTRDSLGWPAFAAVWVILVILTTALAKLTDRLYPRWDRLFSSSPGTA